MINFVIFYLNKDRSFLNTWEIYQSAACIDLVLVQSQAN